VPLSPSLAAPAPALPNPQNARLRVAGLTLFTYLGIVGILFSWLLGPENFDGILTVVTLGALLAMTRLNWWSGTSVVLGIVGVVLGMPEVFGLTRIEGLALSWVSVVVRAASAVIALLQIIYAQDDPADTRWVWDRFLQVVFGAVGTAVLVIGVLIYFTIWSEKRHEVCGREDADGRPVATTWSECAQVLDL
jgi:hypothetical protein